MITVASIIHSTPGTLLAEPYLEFQHTLTMDERDDKEFPTQGHFIKLSQVSAW